MRLLVSGSTASLRRALVYRDYLGILTTPKAGNSIDAILETGLPWAIDNGAYSGFNATAFTKLLLKAEGQTRLLWVACPDVVGDAAATLVQFERWQPAIRRLHMPVALVGQDGLEDLDVPWDEFECLFLGGSTEWKLSSEAWDLCREAKRRGKLVHMGRVNSLRRMRIAQVFGCDSIDGTSVSRYGDTYIRMYCKWIAHRLVGQRMLFEEDAT